MTLLMDDPIFRVGDRVRHVVASAVPGETGRIIALYPRASVLYADVVWEGYPTIQAHPVSVLWRAEEVR